MRARRIATVLCLGLLLKPAVSLSQEPGRPLSAEGARHQGLTFERQGRFGEAAAAYRQGLATAPADVALLVGLERSLARVGQIESMWPFVRRAVETDPGNEWIRGLEFRLGARLGGADSAAAVASRWMAAMPASVMPYREWGSWLAERGDAVGASAVLALGRERFGDVPLAEISAPVLAQAGEWDQAAHQWALAVRANVGLLSPAAASLGRAPESSRSTVLGALMDGGGAAGRWLASDLLLEWGQPDVAWTVLDAALPGERVQAAGLLSRFADRALALRTAAGAEVRGYALERMAQFTTGPAQERARLDAARSFADAGNLVGAQRMLSQLSWEGDRASADAAGTMATFIRVLADAGQVAEAESRYREWESRLGAVEDAEIRGRLAWGWVRRGELERAEALVGADSSVAAVSVRGWIALYRGELDAARRLFREAGPQAQDRDEATRSTGLLVLLERVRAERAPDLGSALLHVTRGDTARGIAALQAAAAQVPARAGRADVLTLAGELATRSGTLETAASIFGSALAADPDGPAAPAAELGLATVCARSGRNAEALSHLEHLILTYPESALVPQARRLLDEIRGAVPKT